MLNRLMLRLAAVNMLTPQLDEPAPTIAGIAVFDSRLEDIEFDAERIELPVILVYAEEDEHVLQDRGRGSGSYERHINLRFELALGSFSATVVDGVKRVTYGLPTTDAELEALLDIFEAQVWRAFWHPVRPASIALQAMIVQVDTWSSSVSRSVSDNNRLAARTITCRCRIPQDCRPRTTLEPVPPSDTVPKFTDAPYLDPLIATLALDPRNAGLMATLREAAGGGPQIQVPAFLRMTPQVYARKPTDPAVLAALANRPVNFVADWIIP